MGNLDFSAALSKNALNIRVANGDVDVFLGENMNITSEQWHVFSISKLIFVALKYP